MKKQIFKKALTIIFFFSFFSVLALQQSLAANYALEIIQPQPNLNTNNRYYKAYPGIKYEVPVVVYGGAYPFTYNLVNAPTGMTIDTSTGIITWSNPTTPGSPHSVTVRVVDNESTAVTRSWTITVTTSGFIFVDAVNGRNSTYNGCSTNCGTGTIANPFRDLCDVYTGTLNNGCNTYDAIRDDTYDNFFLYFRTGTYDPNGYFDRSPGDQQYQLEWRGDWKPVVWLAYPDESPIIDHDRAAFGAFFDWRDGDAVDAFIHGIRFQDFKNHAIRLSGGHDRPLFFKNYFYNGGPGVDGANSSSIMTSGGDEEANPKYHAIVFNTFDTNDAMPFLKLYSTNKIVIANNTFSNITNFNEGLAFKDSVDHLDLRANGFYTMLSGAIGGNQEACGDVEVRYNLVLNSRTSGCPPYQGALSMNQTGGGLPADGPWYIYRNTFEGIIQLLNQITANDGPFYLYNNIIVNNNASCDTPNGSLITVASVVDDWTQIMIVGSGATANLVGSTTSGIIDESGNLTTEYVSYLGTQGHLLSDGDNLVPPPPRGENSSISVPQLFRVNP